VSEIKATKLIVMMSFVVFFLIPFFAVADEKQSLLTPAMPLQLVEVVVKSTSSEIDIRVNDVKVSSNSGLQRFIHKHFILLDAEASPKERIKESVITVFQDGEPLDAKYLSINTLAAYTESDANAVRDIDNVMSGRLTLEQQLNLLENVINTPNLSEWMNQHIILLRSYVQSKQRDWLSAYRSNHSYFLNLEYKLLFQCDLLNDIQQQNENGKESNDLSFLVIELVADMAKTLIEIDRRIKPVVSATSFPELDFITYRRSCGDNQSSLVPEQFSENTPFGYDLIDDARRLLRYAIVRANETESPLLLGRVLARIWYLHNRLGQPEEAIAVARQALHFVANDLVAINEFVEISGQLATSLMEQGRFAETLQVLAEATGKSKNADDYLNENIRFANGFLYRKLGEYESAERYFEQVLDGYVVASAGTLGTPSYDGACRRNYLQHEKSAAATTQLGIIKRQQKKFKEAIALQLCAMDLFAERGEYYKLVSQVDLAAAYLGDNQFELAKKALPDSTVLDAAQKPQRIDAKIIELKLSAHENDQQQVANTISSLAMLFGDMQFFSPCQKLDGDCLSSQESYIFPIKQIQIFEVLINNYSAKKSEQQMEFYFHRASKVIDYVRKQAVIPQAWNDAQYSLVEAYINALVSHDVNNDRNLDARLFEVLENYYSLQVDIERRNYIGSSTEDSSQLSAAFQTWMLAEQQVLKSSAKELHYFQQQALSARTAFFRFEHSNPIHKITLAMSNFSVEQVHENLTENEVFVRYFIGSKQQFALVVYKDGLVKYDLTHLDSRFWESLSNIQNSWPTFIQSLSKVKLLPYEKLMAKHITKVIFVPDYYLHRLPFSALRFDSVDGSEHIVGQYFEMVRTQSAYQYFDKNTGQNSNTKGIALFASSGVPDDFTERYMTGEQLDKDNWFASLGPIPEVFEELEAIKSKFHKEEIFEGVGDDATNQFLLSRQVRNSKLVHIATHGLYNPNSPDVVGIMTASDTSSGQRNIMTLNELFSQPFSAELVVMSGCNTMLGTQYKGSGMRSLTRGFLAQGAFNTLGTLWSVSDKSTAIFMDVFYSKLRNNGNNISKALMLTKMFFIKHRRYKHPKYWAGFVLTSKSKQKESLSLVL
jgi:CHAT domain-containing protein